MDNLPQRSRKVERYFVTVDGRRVSPQLDTLEIAKAWKLERFIESAPIETVQTWERL